MNKVTVPASAQSLCAGLHVLKNAFNNAKTLKFDVWDFAVELRDLSAVGCLNNDLRWLVAQGYIEHGIEISGAKKRRFKKVESLTISGATCFVLTEPGMAFARKNGDVKQIAHANGRPMPGLKPTWHTDAGELWVAHKIVKRFRVPAESQRIILAAFEEQRWVHSIDDPLPPIHGVFQKRRLRETIANLNRNQINGMIHFYGTGTGQRVSWEWRG